MWLGRNQDSFQKFYPVSSIYTGHIDALFISSDFRQTIGWFIKLSKSYKIQKAPNGAF